jgi:hypothetical protein
VHIPLEHYRILGVPHDATLEQLQQAFEDRLQQLPRQQYSNAAIAARKQLLEESFVVLADPERRVNYDQALQSASPSEDGVLRHTLNLSNKQLPGALLLLQEMGDYQTILEIGRAYFSQPIDLSQPPATVGVHEEDVVLAMALAYLELGREEWQQSQFENAAEALQAGLAVLEQEQRFPDIQAEIREDLCKLRPYRILELLNSSAKKPALRQKGLGLLQEMLRDRGGLDGTQDDHSGLNVQDFLRYIQQLREHLTTAEQQELFEKEAARSSAVASYLAVYTLIARGVSQGNPRLIQTAKELLNPLSDRQDIAIEQGMCWLLLGQPVAAHQSVLRSKDKDSLAFLRQYSEGAPDLIPGLYLYTENWLQQEVYPYFQELAHKRVSLQNYFNNPEIQKALSELEPGPAAMLTQAKTAKTPVGQSADNAFLPSFSATAAPSSPAETALQTQPSPGVQVHNRSEKVEPIQPIPAAAPPHLAPELESWARHSEDPVLDAFLAGNRNAGSAVSPAPPPSAGLAKKRLIGQMNGENTAETSQFVVEETHYPSVHQDAAAARSAEFPPPSSPSPQSYPSASPQKRRSPARKSRKWLPRVLPILLGAGVVTGALALGRIVNNKTESPPDPVATAPAPTAISPSPSPNPTKGSSASGAASPSPGVAGSPQAKSAAVGTVSPSPAPNADELSKDNAQQIIKTWQGIKAEAKGSAYSSDRLKEVLAGPILAEWQTSVAQDKANKLYSKYTLNRLDVASVKPQGKTQATVEATVQEKREDYVGGKLLSQKSDTYRVLYRLERQGQDWMIKGMQVL